MSAFVYIVSMAALLLILIPGLASAAVPEEADVWDVVYSARSQNDQVLNQFAVKALAALDVPTLDTHRANADGSLEDIYSWAADTINGYVAQNAGLADTADDALTQVLTEHNEAHEEVGDIYGTILDRLTSPLSTTTIPTVTTTIPTVTTTIQATTTTVPRTTTTTVPPNSPTTTVVGVAPPGDEPPDPPVRSADGRTAASPDDQLWSAPSSMVLGESTPSVDGSMPPMTAAVTDAASVLLPPMLVKVAVAPILVLEVLLRTLFDSVRSLALPALILASALGWFVWRERRALAST